MIEDAANYGVIPYKGYTIRIDRDDCAESPRDWHNLGTIITWSKSEPDIQDSILLPVYLLGHSGRSVSTTPFNDKWDSGQVGIIYVSRAKVREEYGVKRITKDTAEKVRGVLRSEIEALNQYLNGEVYGYLIENGAGEELDSCWGMYGHSYTVDEAKAYINAVLPIQLELFTGTEDRLDAMRYIPGTVFNP